MDSLLIIIYPHFAESFNKCSFVCYFEKMNAFYMLQQISLQDNYLRCMRYLRKTGAAGVSLLVPGTGM